MPYSESTLEQGDLHKFVSARACSLSRAQSAQGCTAHGCARKTIKKQAGHNTLLVFVVELRGVEPLSEKL